MPEPFQSLGYALYACCSLEDELLDMGWPQDAAHFQARQREIRNELQKLTKGKKK